jgi:chemotaxis protein MotA
MNHKKVALIAVAAFFALTALALGADLAMFINPIGLILVVGGTLTGVFLAFPLQNLADLWETLKKINNPKMFGTERLVRIFVGLAKLKRKHGVRVLEAAAGKTGNDYLELGVALVADDRPINEIRDRLEQEFEFFVSRRDSQRAVLSLAGRLAPAFGLAGTMIGLIRMLHMIKDPSEVTAGMSVALLTTFYGIMLANLLILPLERKVNELTRSEAVEMTLITEGIMGLAADDNGAAMDARLGSFRYAQPTGEQNLKKLDLGAIFKGLTSFKTNPLARSTSHER